MKQFDDMKTTISYMLQDMDRYNPENLEKLEQYVECQARENTYDLEANLAVLKLYQFNPKKFNMEITCQILLKALTNLPHTDFVLCKCLLSRKLMEEKPISQIIYLGDILEQCKFQDVWTTIIKMSDLCNMIVGFQDSIRIFVCNVLGITFQTIDKALLAQLLGDVDDNVLRAWVDKYGWREESKNIIFIANQDENIKTKNITEKIDFESISSLMAACL